MPGLVRAQRDWFGSLRWWQKLLFAIGVLIAFLVLILLPNRGGAFVAISLLFFTMVLSFVTLKPWHRVVLILALSAGMTVLLVTTQGLAPYGSVVVAIVALALSVVGGWIDAPRFRR